MGTKKRLVLSLVCAMIMVFAMSTVAFADVTNVDVDKTFTASDYDYWTAVWADSSQDNDGLDMDKSKLEVELDMDCLDAPGNSGNIVNDSEEVLIVGIDQINVDLAFSTDRSYNVGSFNVAYIGTANTTYINSGNEFTSNTTITNKAFCDNDLDVTLSNIANDNSKKTVDITECEYELEVEDCGNTIGSFNDIGCDNTVVDNDFFNYASFNDDCDGNLNDIVLDI